MEIVVDNENRLVEVWLTREESISSETEAALKLICDKYSKMKMKIAVFRSGSGNLSDYIEALVRLNRGKTFSK